jgi:arginine decarboxylase
MSSWNSQKSAELYAVDRWGADFYSVDTRGHMRVKPSTDVDADIDLLALVRDLKQRGLRTPLLIRFSDILASRVNGLADDFEQAIEGSGYRGRYRGVYPIKVNQQRHVVEEIVEFGAARGIGLEAGSKPELLVALAVLDTPDALIICNGFKDRAYLESALLAQRLGRYPVIVIDRYSELEGVIKAANELGIRPHIGMRARLSAQGAGRWLESTGRRSKFGLSPSEIVQAVDRLRSEDMLDCLELLHFHIGSQITAIRAHKEALREISRIYVGLHELGAHELRLLDVGGGLAVDYDGSGTDYHSSKNYSAQEYANDVVDAIQSTCEAAGVAHPDIVTESGRAMVAHHSVLVFDVLGADQVAVSEAPPPVSDEDHEVLRNLAAVLEDATPENARECYHDAVQLREEATSLFALGYLDLTTRARLDRLYHHCCQELLRLARQQREVPEDLRDLERALADTYFGNFSVFQSAPDHWAVKQLFPVMPIHRLDEEPTRHAVVADLTCDSDGKIDRFIGRDESKRVLPLHAYEGEPYYLGVFLVGAYQEILGDLHNLFGDTDAVHVRLDRDGRYVVEHVVEGDAVSDVLGYVQYDRRWLIEKVRRTAEDALRRGEIGLEESARLRRRYEQGLYEYTYLKADD